MGFLNWIGGKKKPEKSQEKSWVEEADEEYAAIKAIKREGLEEANRRMQEKHDAFFGLSEKNMPKVEKLEAQRKEAEQSPKVFAK